MAAKRGYSHSFPSTAANAKRYNLQGIPAGLWRSFGAKCRRLGVSKREAILAQLGAFVADESLAEFRQRQRIEEQLADTKDARS